MSIFRKKHSEAVSGEYTHPSREVVLQTGSKLHPDLNGLIWFGDGPNKNYTNPAKSKDCITVGPIEITLTYYGAEEPSLIHTKQPIAILSDIQSVERPPYYPSYSALTPEQKFVYLKLLSNPYDPSINIGFVFILYYGLERHLLAGNFEKAFRMILNLRDVHANASFQSYSASALILSAMLHERGDMVLEFIESLDKDFEFNFSDNLFLLCYYSFDHPVRPHDIMRMARSFGFTNTNYLRKYPEVFNDTLRSILLKSYGVDNLQLKSILTPANTKEAKLTKERLFANMSLVSEGVAVPQLAALSSLQRQMKDILKSTHEEVKKNLASRRKSGRPLPKKKESAPKDILIFDPSMEALLLSAFRKATNSVSRHFALIHLQDFYYKYRGLGSEYIQKCKDYCQRDIESLGEMFQEYVAQEIAMARELESLNGKEYTRDRIKEIKKNGFIGSIPAFSRLSIIYEKEGDYAAAIAVCKKAIEYNQNIDYFEKKLGNLMRK